jgi:hypothetical protein
MTSTLISNIVIAMKEVSGSFVNSMDTSKEFTVEGLKYRILSQEDRTVEIVGYFSNIFGRLNIPARILANGIIYTIVAIGKDAFSWSKLISISIPPTITIIGDCAFYGCYSLTSIEIPNSVTQIGCGVFAYCIRLKSVKIPNSVTKIGDCAFYGCIRLRSVKISNSVTQIGNGAFRLCIGLTTIAIPDSVTQIGNNAFAYLS